MLSIQATYCTVNIFLFMQVSFHFSTKIFFFTAYKCLKFMRHYYPQSPCARRRCRRSMATQFASDITNYISGKENCSTLDRSHYFSTASLNVDTVRPTFFEQDRCPINPVWESRGGISEKEQTQNMWKKKYIFGLAWPPWASIISPLQQPMLTGNWTNHYIDQYSYKIQYKTVWTLVPLIFI